MLRAEPANAETPAQVVALDGACSLSREEIGGKGWSVNRMRALGLPVPPAFVVTIHACREYYANDRVVGDKLWGQIVDQLNALEHGTGRHFGGAQRPLLVSVRSGAANSMPGMMDTILNLGINAAVEVALAAESGDARYAADTRQRFVEQYRKVVLGGSDEPMSGDPWAQLRAAVAAVFDSWHSPRAQVYRRNRGLSDNGGTAVTIQAMVFGNLDERSGTGVLFSRNPITGDPPAWGEWLKRAQGEDVVSGQRTPKSLDALRRQMPNLHAELMRAAAALEADARDIQDIEFTVESGRLWMLQSRVAKRSPQAAIHAAVAFAEAGLISQEEAVRRLHAEQIRHLPRLELAPEAARQPPFATGEPACPGVASGMVVTDPEQAEARAARGENVILARGNTSPEDLQGIIAARAVITEHGGSTSHAAVVSRELGRPCVVGCGSHTVTALAGQQATVDGASGRIWAGNLAVDQADEAATGDLRKLIAWGLPLIPLQLLKPDQAPADAIDLDAQGERWRAALKPAATVRGSVLESDDGIRAALAAGVHAAVVQHRLPALLACLQGTTDAAGVKPAQGAASVAAGADISELTLLRLAGLKGRAGADILADALSVPVDVAAESYLALCDQGLCANTGSGFRLTQAGHARLSTMLGEEREQTDRDAVIAQYEEFCVLNAELKQIMTAWQLRSDGTPNGHNDADYDRAVLKRLANLHARAGPLLQCLPQLSPRLAAYGERLARAAARIAGGDVRYVARLIADSYHTVWFELHEDLLSLAGLTRGAGVQPGTGTAPVARSRPAQSAP